ncbi:hypothetical protein lerEdw1_002251 [Lerista edwardsae]|nr:hypothetical protein lerEdw1_002251 [Lerista edwardsae]
MSLKRGLYACDGPADWRGAFNVYRDVVEAKGSKQKKLITLDQWYQEELPVAIAGRKEKYLTREELVKLMEWKLSRGRFRPRLQQLVSTNTSEMVEQCTKMAFQLLPNVEASIAELSKLKAVGPATASAAVLAAGAPESVAFMADEAVEAIPGLAPVQYTLRHYMLFLDKIRGCVKKLNKADPDKSWTPHRVEMALWAWAVAEKLQLPSLPAIGPARGKSSSDEEADEAPRKRQRRR